MKKYLSVLCMLLALATVFALAACTKEPAVTPDNGDGTTAGETKKWEPLTGELSGEEKPAAPTTAGELWKLVYKKMNDAKSYEADAVLDMIMYMSGYKFESKMTGYEIVSNTDDYYYYSYANVEMVCDELSFKETQKTISAYNEGTAFTSDISGTKAQNLCSKMTADEFKDYANSTISDEFDYEACTEAEFSKNSDGSWNLSFSGYTKKAVKVFLDEIGIDDGDLGMDIMDMKISLIADAEYQVREMSLEFIFDAEETDTAVPVMKALYKYSKYNTAERITTGIEPSGYKEVADIRVLSDLTDGIYEFCNQAEGAFTLDTKQVLRDSTNEVAMTEKDTVTFGRKNGSYVYAIDVDYNGTKMSVSYKSGVQTVTAGGETQNVACTDDEAKAYVDDLINTAKYDSVLVDDINKVSDGVYRLFIEDPETEAYESYLTSMGMTFKSATQEIIVTFVDGKMTKLESEVKSLGEYTANGKTENISFDVLTVITVNEVSAPGQTA